MGYLSRMTQWKVRSASFRFLLDDDPRADIVYQSKLNISPSSTLEDKGVGSQLKLGLFSYPVLQAADVLVHRYGFALPSTYVRLGTNGRG